MSWIADQGECRSRAGARARSLELYPYYRQFENRRLHTRIAASRSSTSAPTTTSA